ncbi:MAG: MCE family protein [Phycisphaerales bacterium]|nr:MCE family protein [Phycisphaerales bacterium]
MRDFMIGLTAIIGLLGLAAMLLVFGEFRAFREASYPITFQLDTAANLSTSSPVTLNGVRIGRIADIATAPDPRDGVVIGARILEVHRIPSDVQVSISRDLIGDAALALHVSPDPTRSETRFLNPGDSIEATAAGFLDEVTDLIDRRLASLERAAESFQRLSDTYVRVGEQISDFIEPRSAEQVDAGAAGPNLMSTVQRIDQSVAAAQVWLRDDEFRGDMKTTVEAAANTMVRLADAIDAWTEAASSIAQRTAQAQEGIDDAVGHFVTTTDMLAATLGEIQFLTAQINSGEGTIGNLVNNPDLYHSLEDAAVRLEKALLEAQLLVEKYRKEGIPIQW